MLKAIKTILMSVAVTAFLIIILSLGAVGFLVFAAISLGYFVAAVNRSLKKMGL